MHLDTSARMYAFTSHQQDKRKGLTKSNPKHPHDNAKEAAGIALTWAICELIAAHIVYSRLAIIKIKGEMEE